MLDLPINTALTMDPRGRITLPTKLHGKLLGERIGSLVWVPFQNHLRAYTPADWKKAEAPMLAEDGFDAAVAERHRRRLALANEFAIDEHGRVVLTPFLRQRAALVRDCYLVSYKDMLELWDLERWNAWVAGE